MNIIKDPWWLVDTFVNGIEWEWSCNSFSSACSSLWWSKWSSPSWSVAQLDPTVACDYDIPIYTNTGRTPISKTLGHKAAQCRTILSDFSCMHLPYSSWCPKALDALTNQGLQRCFIPCASIAISILYLKLKFGFRSGQSSHEIHIQIVWKVIAKFISRGSSKPIKK